jgi:hypothetical protein
MTLEKAHSAASDFPKKYALNLKKKKATFERLPNTERIE